MTLNVIRTSTGVDDTLLTLPYRIHPSQTIPQHPLRQGEQGFTYRRRYRARPQVTSIKTDSTRWRKVSQSSGLVSGSIELYVLHTLAIVFRA